MSVASGYIAAEMVAPAPREALDRVVAKIRAGRLGQPDQVAPRRGTPGRSHGVERGPSSRPLGPWTQGGRVKKPGPGCCNCVSVSRAGVL